MRVSFGLDGVFADAEGTMAEVSARVLQTDVARLSAFQRRMLARILQATENFWEQLDEIEPGPVARLASLADERRWEVIFLIRRFQTAGRTAQRQSQQWLVGHGYKHPSVFLVDGPLAVIVPALHLDAVVDSPFEYSLEPAMVAATDTVETSADATRLSQPRRLGSVNECLRRLCDIDEARTPWGQRLVSRIRLRGRWGREEIVEGGLASPAYVAPVRR